jgi:hypothetical protein
MASAAQHASMPMVSVGLRGFCGSAAADDKQVRDIQTITFTTLVEDPSHHGAADVVSALME